MDNNYGTVMTQDCYRDKKIYRGRTLDGYFAAATDDQDDYLIYWPIVDIDAQDESDACDWTNYRVFKL
jgi:hypothetical protein